MWQKKLGLSVWHSFGLTIPEAMQLVKDTGFDAVSPEWMADGGHLAYIEAAKERGLILQSLHAPFHKAKDMWGDDEEKAAAALGELMDSLQVCAQHGIPIMVVHAFIGFKDHEPTSAGLARFKQLADAAQQCGIQIALENTEGEEYLAALMEHLRDHPAVGFCWDSGHEMCYNHSQDMLGRFGDRLLVTHLNDNLGIRDFAGDITWHDDLHLLPYDGIADWDEIAARLKKTSCPDILNFELNLTSKPNRHDNELYAAMTPAQYLSECYKRACRVAVKLLR